MEKPMLSTCKHCDEASSGDKRSRNSLNKWFMITLLFLPLLLVATFTTYMVCSLRIRIDELNSKLDTLEKGLTVDKKSLISSTPQNLGVSFFKKTYNSRLRRHLTGAYTPVSHLTGSGTPGGAKRVHLISNILDDSQEIKFQWRQPSQRSPAISGFTNMILEDELTAIKINMAGLYMVYSQVTYVGHPSLHGRNHARADDAETRERSTKQVGHETVLRRYGSHTTTVLMRSVHTTVKRRGAEPQDSNYHAGVFYLKFGDRLYVRPLTPHTKYNLSPENSFFGTFLIQ